MWPGFANSKNVLQHRPDRLWWHLQFTFVRETANDVNVNDNDDDDEEMEQEEEMDDVCQTEPRIKIKDSKSGVVKLAIKSTLKTIEQTFFKKILSLITCSVGNGFDDNFAHKFQK